MARPRTLVDGQSADSVPVDDRGLRYGDGLFETIRVVDGNLCRLDRHLSRLQEGTRRLALGFPDREAMKSELTTLVASETGVLRLTLTRGDGERGYASAPAASARRIAQFNPQPIPQWPESGVTLALCKTRLALQPALAGLKHLNRLEQVLGASELHPGSETEGIMLSTDGRVIECTASNLFCVSEGRLITPGLADCGVSGVMREWICETWKQGVMVQDFRLETLEQAQEVFVSNSIRGIGPVTRFGQFIWKAGPVASELARQDRLQTEAGA